MKTNATKNVTAEKLSHFRRIIKQLNRFKAGKECAISESENNVFARNLSKHDGRNLADTTDWPSILIKIENIVYLLPQLSD